LGNYLKNNRKITELDISWNKLKPKSYYGLLEALSQSRSITHLNLGWNMLFEEEEHLTEGHELKEGADWYINIKLKPYN
jgi:hypothetical protein